MQRACSVCGVEFPRTSEYWHRGGCSDGFGAACKECASARTRAWHATKYQPHPRPKGESDEAKGRRLAFHHAYYAARREEMKAAQKAWYEAHKGDPEFKARKAALEKAWLADAANRESKLAYRKAHHEARRDHDNATNRAWALAHPDNVRSCWLRRRALQAGAAGSFTAEDLRAQHEKQLGLCFYCGRPLGKRFDVDHYIPLSRGGSNAPDNIVLACGSCNRSKGNKLPEEFMRHLAARLARKQK